MSTQTRLMTADEFLDMPDDGLLHELVRGEVVTMSLPGGEHGEIAGEFFRLIANHVRSAKLGKTYAAETGFIIERDPDTVRGPDVAFVRAERLREISNPQEVHTLRSRPGCRGAFTQRPSRTGRGKSPGMAGGRIEDGLDGRSRSENRHRSSSGRRAGHPHRRSRS